MDVTVTFIGNATTLISGGGVTLLTDPNFLHGGQHAYLGYGLVLSHMQGEALNLPKMIPVLFDDYGVFASPLSDFIELERSATVSI